MSNLVLGGGGGGGCYQQLMHFFRQKEFKIWILQPPILIKIPYEKILSIKNYIMKDFF